MKKLLREVSAPGLNPNLCLRTPLVPTPYSRIANSSLINPWRALLIFFPQLLEQNAAPLVTALRESSLLTTCWSRSTVSSRRFGGPSSSHGNLNFLFQIALHLPSWHFFSNYYQRRLSVAPCSHSHRHAPVDAPRSPSVPSPPSTPPNRRRLPITPKSPSFQPRLLSCSPLIHRPSRRPLQPVAPSTLEESSVSTRTAALPLEVLEGLRDQRATRLLHPCYPLRGALVNPQEESPRTRNHLRYPLPGATFNPPNLASSTP